MKHLLFAVACIFALSAVSAFVESDVSAKESVYLNESKTVFVDIENTSLQDKELSIEFFAPSAVFFDFSGVPEKIKAESSETVSLYLSPSYGLEGTTYKSTLLVKLGNETVLKEISIHMSKDIPAIVIPGTPKENGGEEKESGNWLEGLSGMFSLGAFGGCEGVITYFLIAMVIVLFLVFLAKLVSIERNKRRGEFG